jgi:hypothetical protein
MKPTIENLKTIFVIKVESKIEEDMWGKKKNVNVTVGNAHIFELQSNEDGILVRVGYSFCGIDASRIGEVTKEYQKLPIGMTVCPECEKAWKAHPRSPWLAWQKSVVEVVSE